MSRSPPSSAPIGRGCSAPPLLIHLDPERAEILTDAVLAQVYASWPRLDDPYAYAHPGGGESGACRASACRVTRSTTSSWWTSTPSPTRSGDDILDELAALTEDERRILVLASYTRLPLVGIASVLDRDVTDVIAQLRAATDRLQTMPRAHGRRHLAVELARPRRRSPRTREVGRRTKGRSVLAPPPPAQVRGGGRRPDRRSRAGDPAGGAAPHSGRVPRPGSRHEPSHHGRPTPPCDTKDAALPDRDRLWLAVRDGGRDQLLP